ncbi:hypothetical protein MKD41_09120 [Lutibacter sp. A64]|uniref:hypothetical protein n=1 Tax=Lutibacter sp. A64 TaxID=2918526 RepID=UPI001F05F241|nr:hypothetical protein [Lutibacter sp. A64]UMB52502.1 hypothetical protein MKD41_09120 [Lutibacter sp. A64]
MLNKIKYPTILYIIAFSIMLSCSEDLGNYGYKEINEVNIEGLENEYTGLLGQPFEIIPTLNFTKDSDENEDDYEY